MAIHTYLSKYTRVQILVTYFQILGSFTMFSITWPRIAYTMISWFESTFKFEVLQMPGFSIAPPCASRCVVVRERALFSFANRPTPFFSHSIRYPKQFPLTTPYAPGTAIRETRRELSLARSRLRQHPEDLHNCSAGRYGQLHVATAASGYPRLLALHARCTS